MSKDNLGSRAMISPQRLASSSSLIQNQQSYGMSNKSGKKQSPTIASSNQGQTFDNSTKESRRSNKSRIIIKARDLSDALTSQDFSVLHQNYPESAELPGPNKQYQGSLMNQQSNIHVNMMQQADKPLHQAPSPLVVKSKIQSLNIQPAKSQTQNGLIGNQRDLNIGFQGKPGLQSLNKNKQLTVVMSKPVSSTQANHIFLTSQQQNIRFQNQIEDHQRPQTGIENKEAIHDYYNKSHEIQPSEIKVKHHFIQFNPNGKQNDQKSITINSQQNNQGQKHANTSGYPSSMDKHHHNSFIAHRVPTTVVKTSSSKINNLQQSVAQSYSQTQLSMPQISPGSVNVQIPKTQILSKGLKLMRQKPLGKNTQDTTERPSQWNYSQLQMQQDIEQQGTTILSDKVQSNFDPENFNFELSQRIVKNQKPIGTSGARRIVQPQIADSVSPQKEKVVSQTNQNYPTFQGKHNSVGQNQFVPPAQLSRNSPIQSTAPEPSAHQDEQIFQKSGQQIAGFKVNSNNTTLNQVLQMPLNTQAVSKQKTQNLSVFEMNFLKGQGVYINNNINYLQNQQASQHQQHQQYQQQQQSQQQQQYQMANMPQHKSPQKVTVKTDPQQASFNFAQQMILAQEYRHSDSIPVQSESIFGQGHMQSHLINQSPYKLSSKSNSNVKAPGQNNQVRLKQQQVINASQIQATSQNHSQLITGTSLNLPFNKIQNSLEQFSNIPSPQKPRMKSTNLSDQLYIQQPQSNLIYQHKNQQKQNSLQPSQQQLPHQDHINQIIPQNQFQQMQPITQGYSMMRPQSPPQSESPLKTQLVGDSGDQIQVAIQNVSKEQDHIIRQIIAQNKGQIDTQNLQIILEQINRSVQNQQGHQKGQIFPILTAQPNQNAPLIQMMYNQGQQVTYQLNTSQLRRNIAGTQPKRQTITDLYGKEKAKSKIPFENAYVEDCYKFIVSSGNNSQLIRKALERRSWWIEIPSVHSMFNFKWQPTSTGIRFERLSAMKSKPGEQYGMGHNMTSFNTTMGGGPQAQSGDNNGGAPTISDLNQRQCVNHMEFHHHLSEKFNLLNVMTKYCDSQKENVFDICPVTFYVEMPNIQKESAYQQALLPFLQYYQALEDNKKVINELKAQLEQIQDKQLDRDPNGQDNDDNGHFQFQEDGGKEGFDNDNDQADGDINDENNSEHGSPKTKDEKDKKSKSLLSNQGGIGTIYKTPVKDSSHVKSTKFKSFNFEKRTFTKYNCPLSHFDGHNLWLLKPTHLNRGRGIHVFSDLPTLHKLIKEYCVGKDEESWKKKQKQFLKEENNEAPTEKQNEETKIQLQIEELEQQDTTDMTQEQIYDHFQKLQSLHQSLVKTSLTKSSTSKGAFKIKHNDFIIQKYIERPQLIMQRKFDFRVWVLFDQDQNLYIFKEGYIRMSGSDYGIDPNNVDNAAVHLTNNAVQKNLDTYGKYEDGNIISYKRYQEILNEEQPECGIDIYEHIVPMMKAIILKTFYAVRKTIDPQKRKYTFEMFGYDFILDEDFNTWLIEVNTNPCLEESNQLLKDYIPRAIEDMFKLTIDKIFPKHSLKRKRNPIQMDQSVCSPGKKPSSKKHAVNKTSKNKNLQKIEETPEGQDDQEEEAGSPLLSPEKEEPTMTPEEAELDKQMKALKRIHPVRGFSDSENMWEKLINVEKCSQCPPIPTKDQNTKNRYTIAVQDKVFKIKKNPYYVQKRKQQQHEKSQKNLQINNNEAIVAEAQALVSEEVEKQLSSAQDLAGS